MWLLLASKNQEQRKPMPFKTMVNKKKEFNDEPVEYCTVCLSLKTFSLPSGDDSEDIGYCGDCGNTDLDHTHIVLHKRMYKEKYGKDYLDS